MSNENEPNWDGMGLRRSKPRPRLFDIRLEDYQLAVQWFKNFLLRNFDFKTELVELDAPINVWRFRDAGEGMVVIAHDLVERAEVALQAVEDHQKMQGYLRKSE